MSGASLITLGLAAIVAVVNWRAVLVGARTLEYVAKPLTIVLLIATALLLEPADATQRDWFVAALVAAMVGDVALMLPSAEAPGAREHVAAVSSPPATFLVGLLAFLLAHLGYIGGLLFGEHHLVGVTVGVVVTLVVAATPGRAVVRGSMRVGDRIVTVAIVSYLVVISGMVIAAYGSGRPFAIVGATLFLVSDLLIGWNRFVRPVGWARIAIMVTYHLGQAGLVLSLLG